jgi:hypothetical protein
MDSPKHNDVFIRITKFFGIRERQAYILKERKDQWGYPRRQWEYFTTDYGGYVCGYKSPSYPVPAIQEPWDVREAGGLFHYYVWHGWMQAQGIKTRP